MNYSRVFDIRIILGYISIYMHRLISDFLANTLHFGTDNVTKVRKIGFVYSVIGPELKINTHIFIALTMN